MVNIRVYLFLVYILLSSCSLFAIDVSENEAQEIARNIYEQTVEQSIQDAETVANIVGSIIIHRIKDNESEIAASERKKQVIIEAATMAITPIVMRIIRRIKNRQPHRNRISSTKVEYYIDEIAEKVLEINENQES